MRRRLQGGDQRSAGDVTTETSEFLGRNDDDFVTTVHCHMLGPLVTDPADQLAEPRFRIL
jgi:hypothetical protein